MIPQEADQTHIEYGFPVACVAAVFLWGRASRDRAAIELAAILDARAKGKLGREENEGEGGGGRGKEKKTACPETRLFD